MIHTGTGASARERPCPQCGRAPEPGTDPRTRPFCSERCKMLDFGAWASESYRIPARDTAADAPDDLDS